LALAADDVHRAVIAATAGVLLVGTATGVVAGGGVVVWGLGTAAAMWCVVAATAAPGWRDPSHDGQR